MLEYLVVEVGPTRVYGKTYVYDSRTKESHAQEGEFTGKRELFQHYISLNPIGTVVSIYEYALPSGRSQLVCWFHPKETETN